jgi:hypothetical protein
LESGAQRNVTGTISGKGFARGDTVIVDGDMEFPCAFGNDRFITTAIPVARIAGRQTSRIEVFRASSLERSSPFPVTWINAQ